MAHPTTWAPISSARREIRLLDLAPKSSDPNQLSCDLRVVSLDDNPSYEALSYVWGEKADPPDVLRVGGEQYEITRNLIEALHSLRSDNATRTLWIDALCINQTDNEERSWQVSMMGDIYKTSAMVLAWLGSDNADLIRDVHVHVSDLEKHFLEFPERLLHTRARESWWRRAWTLQKAVLGTSLTFCAGKERCSALHLSGYLNCILYHMLDVGCCKQLSSSSTIDQDDLLVLIDSLRQSFDSNVVHRTDEEDLLKIALDHQDRIATDPRDKVFAFIGMAYSQSVPSGLVQYGMSLHQTMIDTATKFLQKSNTLEVIRHAPSPLPGEEDLSDRHKHLQSMGVPHSMARLQNLPSWCPDWTQDIPHRIFHSMRRYREQIHGRFGTGMAHQAKVTFYNDNCLGVTGIKCDTVLYVGDWAQSFVDVATRDETLGQWCYLVANSLAHRHGKCGGCQKNIYGVIFRCQVCKAFDFCSRCMQAPPMPHPGQHKCSPSYFDSRPADKDKESWNERSEGLLLSTFMEMRKEGAANIPDCSLSSPWDQLLNVEYPFTSGESLQDAFRRTTLTGLPIPRDSTNDCTQMLSAAEEMAAFATQWRRDVDGPPFSLRVSESSKYGQQALDDALRRVTDTHRTMVRIRIRATLERRRMVVSQMGYLGIAPAGTRVGDHICVLHGGEMPFILRQRSVDDSSGPASNLVEHYDLVGETYVHGLMHGEAVAAADAGELQRAHVVLH